MHSRFHSALPAKHFFRGRQVCFIVLACCTNFIGAQAFGQPTRVDCWHIHALDTLGGPFGTAADMNDRGEIAGTAATEPRIVDSADPPYTLNRPFRSEANGGLVHEIQVSGKFYGDSTAINNRSEIVGGTTIGSSFPTAFISEPKRTESLNTLYYAWPVDINNVGYTLYSAGYSELDTVLSLSYAADTGETRANTLIISISGAADSDVEPIALNDRNDVAVNVKAGTAPGIYRWNADKGAVRIASDVTGARATDMNRFGQIIGVVSTTDATQAFITRYFDDAVVLIGTPGDGNEPTGVNDLMQITGTHNVDSGRHGYVTSPFNVRGFIDIDSLTEVSRDGWSNMRPIAVNNRGQIAGTGTLNGEDRVFFLAPRSLQAYIPDFNGEHAKCYRW